MDLLPEMTVQATEQSVIETVSKQLFIDGQWREATDLDHSPWSAI